MRRPVDDLFFQGKHRPSTGLLIFADLLCVTIGSHGYWWSREQRNRASHFWQWQSREYRKTISPSRVVILNYLPLQEFMVHFNIQSIPLHWVGSIEVIFTLIYNSTPFSHRKIANFSRWIHIISTMLLKLLENIHVTANTSVCKFISILYHSIVV